MFSEFIVLCLKALGLPCCYISLELDEVCWKHLRKCFTHFKASENIDTSRGASEADSNVLGGRGDRLGWPNFH